MTGDTRGDTSVSLRMPRSLGDNQLLPALSDEPVPATDLGAGVGDPLPACVDNKSDYNSQSLPSFQSENIAFLQCCLL